MRTLPCETVVPIRVSPSVVASAASSGLAMVSSITEGSTPGLLTETFTCG